MTIGLVRKIVLVIYLFYVFTIDPLLGNNDDEYTDHRIRWLEESIRTFVFETQPEIARIEKELDSVKEENKLLKTQIAEQQNKLHDLEWAAHDIQTRTLTREERDAVSEMKWRIFDLNVANEELQEEACLRSSQCTEWTEWSHCSLTCGTGTKIRSRNCRKTGKFSSMCKPETVLEEQCSEGKCAKIPNFPQLDCPDTYESYQGYCFRFSGRQDNRLLSTILCEEEAAHLVSIGDKMKQKVVYDYLKIVAPTYMVDMHEDFSKREYWDFQGIATKTNVAIDGIRKHQVTYYLNWRDQSMTYFNWAKGQPRNNESDGDYCVTLNVLTGKWYLNCCSRTFFYMCESEKRDKGLQIGN